MSPNRMLTQTTGTSHDSAHPKPKRILKLYASIFFYNFKATNSSKLFSRKEEYSPHS
jgi:hypothetical protein